MRGLLTWALIAIVIVLILLAAYSAFFTGAVEAGTDIIASMQAAHIAGILNTLQTAPENAQHVYELPMAKCEIEITSTAVHVNLPDKKQSYSANLMKSGVAIDEKTGENAIQCSDEEARAIRFVKKNGRIEITQLPVIESD